MGGFMREKEKLIVEKRRPDCVTEVKIGSSVLVVNGFLKQDGRDTATDKMLKLLDAENYLNVSKKCC